MFRADREHPESSGSGRPARGGRGGGGGVGGGGRGGNRSGKRGGERGEEGGVFDPGWLLLISGLALIGAALVLPAQEELRLARIDRDVAVALKDWRQRQHDNYESFADRLENPDDALLLSLVTTQLNMIPVSSQPVLEGGDAAGVMHSASPFPELDPAYQPPVVHEPFRTILMNWTSSPRGRLLLIALGMLMVFVGVLPPARGSLRG
ncbi:MAG: hypothetical protein ACTS3F_00610 [Phycisphaerales bacterium]